MGGEALASSGRVYELAISPVAATDKACLAGLQGGPGKAYLAVIIKNYRTTFLCTARREDETVIFGAGKQLS